MAVADLTLDLPWVGAEPEPAGDLVVRRGRSDTLRYDDGISLEVLVLDPGEFRSADEIVEAARDEAAPGRVALVAGAVPLAWRAALRDAEVSFVDVSGVAEIRWPRLQVSAKRFGKSVKRRRSSISLQKSRGLIVEELLIAAFDDASLTIGELAERSGVSVPSASRAVTQLAQHGLVVKEREGNRVWVRVVDRVEIAQRLAHTTAWPGDETLTGFLWGRSVFDVAARISEAAQRSEVDLAVTGRVAAAYLGVLGTSSPSGIWCWVHAQDHELAEIAEKLALEPAPEGAANVLLSSDPWRLGIHRRSPQMLDDWSASIAHPVRVWCDLHSEPRGTEFAAQMWKVIGSA